MGTTREEIAGWFDRGVKKGATHLIVACDTFDHEDYPVYVEPGEDPREVAARYSGVNMQTVMEVYALHLDKATQLAEHRAFHYDMPNPSKPDTVFERLLKDEG